MSRALSQLPTTSSVGAVREHLDRLSQAQHTSAWSSVLTSRLSSLSRFLLNATDGRVPAAVHYYALRALCWMGLSLSFRHRPDVTE
jgi:hypothetical protein